MNINFELYRIFYIVANSKSISEASKKLFISQPAVTKSIHNLEKELKGELFVRSNKGIALTEEGKKFYNFIRPAVEQIVNAEKEFSNIAKIDIGEIKIGTSNTILKYFLLNHLKTFTKEFPSISIAIEESYTPDLINMVKNGVIDIAIIYAADDDSKLEGLKIYNLQKLHYCIIGNKQYKKYLNRRITPKELKEEKLILNTINPIQRLLLGDEKDLKAYINLASHSLVYEFVKEGFGIGLAIKEFVADELKQQDLYELKLDEPLVPLNLIMITSNTNFPNYATMQLINLIESKNTTISGSV
jgi:DNA-binding transcriptional LysR family regulator